ncbi:MAG: NAD(P)/FAD-dependent oxidoreductase [Chloroflexi bacterium]|nr:NAD(P)/FAD-dependent oxidoreductase [Chloroflexota bacterium]
MAGKTVVILGGGMGGLAAAQQLRTLLPQEHRVVVVEKRSTFYMCTFNLRLMAGEIGTREEVERPLTGLKNKGIEWVHGEVLELDPKTRRMRTSAGTLVADYMVIALGAEKNESGIPGFAESALNLYESDGALRIRKAVQGFEKGRAVVLVGRTPFPCPAAPCESALLMDAAFRKKGVRGVVEVAIYTPEPKPFPSAGQEMSDNVLVMLKERDIQYHAKHVVKKIDSAARKLMFDGEEASFDLLVGIPPHAAPRVVRDAGLTDDTGWVPVDLATMETNHPGVFAIGDVTAIRQPNPTGLFLPKAWVFADEQARVVARNVAAQLRGEDASSKFDGKGFCYLEVGDGQAAYGSGNFFAYPAAKVFMEPPSKRLHEERKRTELEQLQSLV